MSIGLGVLKVATRDAKSGNYPMLKVAMGDAKSGNRNDHQRDDHQLGLITNKNYHSRLRRTKPSQPHEFSKIHLPRKVARFPDLTPWNLANPNDLFSIHSILAFEGIVADSYDGLELVVLAAVMARRLSTSNERGYLARILREGFTKYGPADRDRDAAKRIMRELCDWTSRRSYA